MRVSFQIICSTDAVMLMKSRLDALLETIEIKDIEMEKSYSYWKDDRCSILESVFTCNDMDFYLLEKHLKEISGIMNVNTLEQDDIVELSCYTSLPEIIKCPRLSFVVCNVNLK